MKNKTIISHILILFVFISLSFISCKKNDDVDSFSEEMELLNEYIQTNNINVSPTASGLYYIELQAGTGDFAKTGDFVTVKYTGKLLNGNIFDSGTYSFTLGRGTVIAGWDEGVAMMKKGGKAQLIIPSTIGYGAYGSGAIAPYTTLIFNVELLDIK